MTCITIDDIRNEMTRMFLRYGAPEGIHRPITWAMKANIDLPRVSHSDIFSTIVFYWLVPRIGWEAPQDTSLTSTVIIEFGGFDSSPEAYSNMSGGFSVPSGLENSCHMFLVVC